MKLLKYLCEKFSLHQTQSSFGRIFSLSCFTHSFIFALHTHLKVWNQIYKILTEGMKCNNENVMKIFHFFESFVLFQCSSVNACYLTIIATSEHYTTMCTLYSEHHCTQSPLFWTCKCACTSDIHFALQFAFAFTLFVSFTPFRIRFYLKCTNANTPQTPRNNTTIRIHHFIAFWFEGFSVAKCIFTATQNMHKAIIIKLKRMKFILSGWIVDDVLMILSPSPSFFLSSISSCWLTLFVALATCSRLSYYYYHPNW